MPALSRNPDDLLLAALEAAVAMEGATGEPIPLTTGNKIITFKEGAAEAAMAELGGSRTARASDFAEGAVAADGLGDAEALVFDELGIAVVSGESDAAATLTSSMESAGTESNILAVEDEQFGFICNRDLERYLAGFAAASQRIHADLIGAPAKPEGPELPEPSFEADQESEAAVLGVTWGLAACRVPTSRFSGRGIRIAVLDTGMDMGHPDFVGRGITAATFVGQPVQDLHGHGTHCTGTACGPRAPAGLIPRYGVAHESSIFIGKVMTNSGHGTTSTFLGGIDWAIRSGCKVLSCSWGIIGQPITAFTAAGARALSAGSIIIAASGNESNRPAFIAAPRAPASSPSVMSVGALDQRLQVARFSSGRKVDIAGPGVGVLSSLPRPRPHEAWNGTSMAAPHVAGCAALWAQTNATLRGSALWAVLRRTARRLPFPASDVGAGLVQAPQ